MEVRRKEKTLAGLFLRYAAVFCVSTVVLVVGVMELVACSSTLGLILPANYAEKELEEQTDRIRKSEGDIGQWIPQGCMYGVYEEDGAWILGDFSKEERSQAWEYYGKSNIYASASGYYRFFEREDGTVCIVKYFLKMRYVNERWNEMLPDPELAVLLLDTILFLLNTVFLAGRFAKNLQKELDRLREITEKVAASDLEFEVTPSDMKEINEVMVSFGRMKDALQDSLEKQWRMEKEKQEQLAALAHDVKTPLTVIRGNAELMAEELSETTEETPEGSAGLSGGMMEEFRECTGYIRTNVNEIETYLENMRQILTDDGQEEIETLLGYPELEEEFCKMARQIGMAEKIPVSFKMERYPAETPAGVSRATESRAADTADSRILCRKKQILRAWNNLIINAAEHTDRQRGIHISIRQEERAGQRYFAAAVRDFGKGFSMKELSCADTEFYSGDASRHGRRHQGLGLTIAKRFAEAQGGFLEYGNCRDAGAEVSLWLRIC